MKFIRLTALFLTLILFACIEKTNKRATTTKAEQNRPISTNDTFELEKLTKELYEWNETKSSQIDFDPLQIEKTDTIYTRINLAQHKQRLKELKETGFFANQFLENYDKIGLTIDKKLMNKSMVYYIGELPPYGNDANPWCNCQDNPDNYWENITLENMVINNNKASYIWTWGDKFKYKVKAIKENDVWKISYLQGFDINEFIPTKQPN